jgi:hypothetical protein
MRIALVVTVEAGAHTATMGLVGRRQAEATAAGAAELVRVLANAEVAGPGVWLPEQAVAHERFFERLAARGLNPTFEEVSLAAPTTEAASPERAGSAAAGPRPRSAASALGPMVREDGEHPVDGAGGNEAGCVRPAAAAADRL